MGIKRKYCVNDNLFNAIDNEVSAYILGLICADGYLIRNGFGIDLNFKDVELLEKIRLAIHFSGNIREGTHDMRKIGVTSNKIYTALINFGLTKTKSKDLGKLSVYIPEKLQNHFVRGYFDGDGCLSYEKVCTKGYDYRRNRISIRGTLAFLDYMESMCPVEFSHAFSVTWIYYISRKVKVREFCDWIYKDATIFLNRKHERYTLM